MVESKATFVPRLDHEFQYNDYPPAINDFVEGNLDYFNAGAVPYKERINIFSVVRDKDDLTKYIISDFGGDVITPFHENSLSDYNTIRHDILRIMKDFDSRYGDYRHDSNRKFLFVGGKFI